jgi:hypothetical protein
MSTTSTTITHPDGTTVSVTTTKDSGGSTAGSTAGSTEPLGKLTYFPVYAKGLQLAMVAEMSGLQWEGQTTDDESENYRPNSWATITASGAAPFG